MTPSPLEQPTGEELRKLIAAVCNGIASPTEQDRLEELLEDDEEAQLSYLLFVGVHAHLSWQSQGRTNPVEKLAADSQPAPFVVLIDHTAGETPRYFSWDWPMAYLASTVICAIGLWILSLIPVSHPTQFAGSQAATRSTGQSGAETNAQTNADAESPKPTSFSSEFRPLIGQITGMIDCKWSDDATFAFDRAYVPLGRKYALSSGVMEITYDTGAKVILQGPCTYEVESETGGYLSLGKLTARVEKGPRSKVQGSRTAEVASGQWSVVSGRKSKIQNQKSKIPSPQPLAPSPSSVPAPPSPLPSPLFAIRTPTATVTDLGTEFGVEVGEKGHTTSHVFRGSVSVRAAGDNETAADARILHENETARVDVLAGNQSGGNPVIVLGPTANPVDFVRRIVKPTIKTLDLVDVVAGGDGFSGRRDAGIDPTNGQATATPPTEGTPPNEFLIGDGNYHRVEGLPFVNGVFIPDGSAGPVRTDSAGGSFGGFLSTSNRTAGYIWAGGVIPGKTYPIRTDLDGIDYASSGHGLLFLHANKAITFDLEAIRRANPDCKLLRFCAVAGNTEAASSGGVAALADLWVLVDGQMRFRRREINRFSGAMPVTIAIAKNERFLTLAATDGGNDIGCDWTMFGDPRLELLSVEDAASPASRQTP